MESTDRRWSEAIKDCLYQLLADEHWTIDEKSQILKQQFGSTGLSFSNASIYKEISKNKERYKNAVNMGRSQSEWSWEMVSALWHIRRLYMKELPGCQKVIRALDSVFYYRRRFTRERIKAEYCGVNQPIYESATPPPDLIPLETIQAKYRQAMQLLRQLPQDSQNPSNFGPLSHEPSQVSWELGPSSQLLYSTYPNLSAEQHSHPSSQLLYSSTYPNPPAQQHSNPSSQPLFSSTYPNQPAQQHSHPGSQPLYSSTYPNPPAQQHSHPSSTKPDSSILSKPPSWYDDEAELGWMLHMSGQYVEIGMDGKEFVNCSAIGEVLKSHFGDRRVYDYDTVLTELSKSAYQNHDHAPHGIGPYPHPASGQAQPVYSSSSYGQGQSQHQGAAAGHDGHKAPGTSHPVASTSSSSANPGKMESSASKSVREKRHEPYRKDSKEKDKGHRALK